MFAETPNAYCADFGSPVLYSGTGGTQSTMAILDQPGEELLRGRVQSTQYEIEYPASDLIGLKAGDELLIGITPGWAIEPSTETLVFTGPDPQNADSGTFRVIGTPNKVEDGIFLRARLERIT